MLKIIVSKGVKKVKFKRLAYKKKKKKQKKTEDPCVLQICSVVSVTCVKVNVKVNFTLEQATKAQRGSRGIALLFI